ncbi:MAG: 2'-5' RNA ligase [Spirochaetes bacterium RBG_13_51_14]|nr:MAG: 2'-5' RNA ligase [Spirochaetes bacterium RBG_13_51_14]
MTPEKSMTESALQRLFIALPAAGIENCIRPVHEYLAAFPQALKSVSPDNYHITLKFFGETAPDTLDLLMHDFEKLAVDASPLPFTLRGLGAFPNIRRANVLWCNLDIDLDVLRKIQEIIESMSEKHGFEREKRAIKPHLTLARLRRGVIMPMKIAEYIAANGDTRYGESRFDRIVLYRSILRRDGPVYTALAEKPL